MSASLYWKPVTKTSNSLNDQLKFILREEYPDIERGPIHLTSEDTDFLQGLFVGLRGEPLQKAKGNVRVLLDAISKYGKVEVWLSC